MWYSSFLLSASSDVLRGSGLAYQLKFHVRVTCSQYNVLWYVADVGVGYLGMIDFSDAPSAMWYAERSKPINMFHFLATHQELWTWNFSFFLFHECTRGLAHPWQCIPFILCFLICRHPSYTKSLSKILKWLPGYSSKDPLSQRLWRLRQDDSNIGVSLHIIVRLKIRGTRGRQECTSVVKHLLCMCKAIISISSKSAKYTLITGVENWQEPHIAYFIA